MLKYSKILDFVIFFLYFRKVFWRSIRLKVWLSTVFPQRLWLQNHFLIFWFVTFKYCSINNRENLSNNQLIVLKNIRLNANFLSLSLLIKPNGWRYGLQGSSEMFCFLPKWELVWKTELPIQVSALIGYTVC